MPLLKSCFPSRRIHQMMNRNFPTSSEAAVTSGEIFTSSPSQFLIPVKLLLFSQSKQNF